MPSWGPARYCSVRRLWWLPSRAAKAGPIKLALDTKKKVAGLQVVTELKAPDKRGATRIIPRCARDAQRAVGPGTPDVGTQIKPGPIVRRRCHGGRINWSLVGRHGGRCHADVKKDTNHKHSRLRGMCQP